MSLTMGWYHIRVLGTSLGNISIEELRASSQPAVIDISEGNGDAWEKNGTIFLVLTCVLGADCVQELQHIKESGSGIRVTISLEGRDVTQGDGVAQLNENPTGC